MFEDLFGTKDERVESFLYSLLSHSFGLPSSYALEAGRSRHLKARQSPLQTSWTGSYIRSFTVTGNGLIPQFFMLDDNYSVYNRVDRDISVPQGRRFAYDFSQIQQGTLSATLAYEGSPELQVSDECRAILNLIYMAGSQQWKAIPLVYAEAGPFYAGTGIPDRIYLQLPTLREPSPSYRNAIMQNIANHYNLGSYEGISIDVQQDRDTSSMNFQTYVKQIEPEFPYAYYHSIGLIDDEGMVRVSTILGDVRVPANSDQGREQLLKAGQEDPVPGKDSTPPTQEIPIQDLIEDFMKRNS